MVQLHSTPVSRCLDIRLLVFGFEVFDLLAVFMLLAILNFALSPFGGWVMLLTWILPGLLAMALRFGKRGKPENYLLHLARFYLTPGIYHAFQEARPKNNNFLQMRSSL